MCSMAISQGSPSGVVIPKPGCVPVEERGVCFPESRVSSYLFPAGYLDMEGYREKSSGGSHKLEGQERREEIYGGFDKAQAQANALPQIQWMASIHDMARLCLFWVISRLSFILPRWSFRNQVTFDHLNKSYQGLTGMGAGQRPDVYTLAW